MGDVVEYPLIDVVKYELQDGRSHGVGLLVGRNKDRGDAKTLPVEALGLCEVEPLRQEEAGSDRSVQAPCIERLSHDKLIHHHCTCLPKGFYDPARCAQKY